MTEAAAAFSFDATKIWGRVELLCVLNGLQDHQRGVVALKFFASFS
jgi:hypothetical protein